MRKSIAPHSGEDDEGISPLAGAVAAALLALVFGACLLTILDTLKPVSRYAAPSVSHHSTTLLPASLR